MGISEEERHHHNISRELERRREIEDAWMSGKAIECREGDSEEWRVVTRPVFDWMANDYRLYQGPKCTVVIEFDNKIEAERFISEVLLRISSRLDCKAVMQDAVEEGM